MICKEFFVICHHREALSSAYCGGANTKQLNISQRNDLYGRASTRSDLS
jgi:hypothetical protein